jgi:hypothetical protein
MTIITTAAEIINALGGNRDGMPTCNKGILDDPQRCPRY